MAHDRTSSALARIVGRNAHVLMPMEPSGSLAATFLSRMPTDESIAEVRARLEASLDPPSLLAVCLPPDMSHQALRRSLTIHAGTLALALAPDGSWLASAGADGTIRIWDPATGAAKHLLADHSGSVQHLAVAADGSWLASAGADGTIRIWDPATGAAKHLLAGHSGGVLALAVAGDGSWLASGGNDGTVRIWDPAAGAECRELTGHVATVDAIMAAPDGSWLASIGGEGNVRIWDSRSGAVVAIQEASAAWLMVAGDDWLSRGR
jgi:WD40 repeat protein